MEGVSLEQKLDAILRYKNGGESLNSIAKSFNISNTETINFWIKKYQFHGLEVFKTNQYKSLLYFYQDH
ncbi:helix-turn-helix domain-containing protein [Heyndrickxia oleronia]|uniref:helix-turn-helix domain-containing protein n=1 Tax=Heyndrickxia oleronia TaxID=38875 RepID=UPI003CC8207E